MEWECLRDEYSRDEYSRKRDMTLLTEFIEEEVTPEVKSLLLENLNKKAGKQEYTFNRFNISVDFESDIVSIEDDLDVGESGLEQVTVSTFFSSLDEAK